MQKEKIELLPIEIGTNIIKNQKGKIISNENPYIKLLSDPVYRNERWEALAQFDRMLCIIEVKIYATSNDNIS